MLNLVLEKETPHMPKWLENGDSKLTGSCSNLSLLNIIANTFGLVLNCQFMDGVGEK